MAYLDGELPFWKRAAVSHHLQECWQCRPRLDEFQREVLEIARAMREDSFPGPRRTVEAKLALVARLDAIAGESAAAPARRPWIPLRSLGWAAACLTVLAGLWWGGITLRPRQMPSPSEVIARVESAERLPPKQPVHQRFRVITRQLRPSAAHRESRLELWSEPASGRFTTRLEAPDGTLKHAIWQPEPSRRYVYNALRAGRVVPFSSGPDQNGWRAVLFRDDLSLAQLEAALLRWLEERQWRPISLSAEVAQFASHENATLLVERLPEESGRERLTLLARKQSGDVAVEFTMVVDQRGFRPELQCIRYQSPARVLELVFVPERPETTVQTASFEPFAMRPAATKQARAVPETATLRTAPLLKPESDDGLLEVRVWYALHQAGACLGEPVEVLRRSDGTLFVHGVVSTPERNDQLKAVLAALGSNPQLMVSIQSAREVWPDIAPEPEMRVSTQRLRQGSRRRYLEKYFSLDNPAQAAEKFAEEALSHSDSLMAEAWALRRLAETFQARHLPSDAQEQDLRDTMVRDHLLRLGSAARSTRAFLGPVLPGASAAAAWETPAATGDRWERILRVFEHTAVLNKAMLALFAADRELAAPPERLVNDVFSGLQAMGLETESVAACFTPVLHRHAGNTQLAEPPEAAPEGPR